MESKKIDIYNEKNYRFHIVLPTNYNSKGAKKTRTTVSFPKYLLVLLCLKKGVNLKKENKNELHKFVRNWIKKTISKHKITINCTGLSMFLQRELIVEVLMAPEITKKLNNLDTQTYEKIEF